MKRLRNLVNPFNINPEVKIDFRQVFAKEQPLVLDIGFGKGDFLVWMAEKFLKKNFVGLEIRFQFVDRVNKIIAEKGLKNCLAVLANANFRLKELFLPGSISEIYILFPDPWMKKRHHKRRVVSDQFIKDMHYICENKAKIHIKTDEKFMFNDICEKFAAAQLFKKIPNPELPCLTNREEKYLRWCKPIYQLAYRK